MSNLKTLMTIAFTTCLTVPAIAQVPNDGVAIETTAGSIVHDVLAANLDQDGGLNADEYVTFALMWAEAGDDSFKDVVTGGKYLAAFAAHDTDTSVSIEPSELAIRSDKASELDRIEPDGAEMPAPDL